jgi:hypothetical protein
MANYTGCGEGILPKKQSMKTHQLVMQRKVSLSEITLAYI